MATTEPRSGAEGRHERPRAGGEPPSRRPLLATYRLQLHAGFDFDAAAAIAPYLAELGVSHVYCSPYLQASEGSTHGYDTVDPTRVSDDLGGPVAHRRFCDALGRAGLGQVLDIVPNHLAAVSANPWWSDVLENGQAARHAGHFDIDWDPTETKLAGQVLLPVLGDHYGRILEAGELVLARHAGSFAIHYFDQTFPVSPRSIDVLLRTAALRLGHDELAFLAHSAERLPLPTGPTASYERHRDKEVLARLLADLCAREPAVADVLDEVVDEVNADPDALDALLERQNYRLARWTTAAQELDYRRFFDITTLVGLRIEDESVFRDVHGLVVGWLHEGLLDGVRVDHPDGLRDPAQHAERLRGTAGPDAWIVVEKILTGDEELPPWPVDGTTGYDHLNRVLWLYVQPDGLADLGELHERYARPLAPLADVEREAKLEVLRQLLASDVDRITHRLVQVVERHRRIRDLTRAELREVLVELAASFDVYRTYGRIEPDGTGWMGDGDRARLARAAEEVVARRPDLDTEVVAFVRAVLAMEVPGDAEHAVALRFQQLTGPATAKGVEDTTFYRWTRLLAVNEVGGDPDRSGDAVAAFHAHNQRMQADWPRTMLASSTHDTKRSEDVRARLLTLTGGARWWSKVLARLDAAAVAAGLVLPPGHVRWWVWQLLFGAHPVTPERAAVVVQKHLREAKQETSWLRPDEGFEASVQDFVAGALGDPAVVAELAAAVAEVAEPAAVMALGQVLLKLTSPGVPDLYQGTELWDRSLVDPDNRRPVDYELRRALLAEVADLTPAQAWSRLDDGLPKLLVVQRSLALRARRLAAFGAGATYEPLTATGPDHDAVVAFTRGTPEGGPEVAVVVVRRALRVTEDLTTIALPGGGWHDALAPAGTGASLADGPVPVGVVVGDLGVALLEREASA